MAEIKGITVKIGADTTKLSQAIRKMNKDTGKFKSQLKEVDKALKFNPGNIDLIRQKQNLLADTIEKTKGDLKELKAALASADDEGVDKNSAGYRKLQTEIAKAEGNLRSLTAEAVQFNTFSANVMSATARVSALGGKLKSAGQSMRAFSTSVALVGGMAARIGAEFDSSMSKVQAVSGATGAEFDKLRDKAREMGAKTKFSATESAEALNYMAMAGWKTNQMLSGIEGIMNLAAASGEDLATTSDIVTDALTAMGYAASDSGHLADVMASASSNANTNVSMMGETFKYAASVAGAMGYSMEDVALATGLMANAGIKATQAGTSLRSIISRMASPTAQVSGAMKKLGVSITDSSGKARPFRDVLVDLRKAMSGMSETEKTAAASAIAGKNAMSGFLALINSSDKDFDKLATAIDNSKGSAEAMAETMMDNFGGQLTVLKSSLEEAAIAVSDTLTPALKTLAGMVQGATNWFNSLSDSTKSTVVGMVAFAAGAGPVLTVLGTMMEKSMVAVKGFSLLASKAKVAGAAISTSTTSAYAKLVPKLTLANAAMGGWVAILGTGVIASALAIKQTNAITKANDKFIRSTEDSINAKKVESAQAEIYSEKIKDLAGKEKRSAEEKKLMASYVQKLNQLMPGLNLQYDEETDKLNQTSSALTKKIELLKAQAIAQAYATEAQKTANRIAQQTMELEEKRSQYQQNTEELKGLDPNSSKAQKLAADNAKLMNEMNQLSGAIKKNEQTLSSYQTKAEAFTAFQTLEAKAKKAGVKIPADLASAMKNGEVIIPETVKELNRLIDFNETVKKAGKSGKDIPENLQKGIASGRTKIPKTVTGLNNLIKFSKAVSRAKSDGVKIPSWIAKGMKSGKLSVGKAAQAINQQVKFEKALAEAKSKGIKIPDGLAKGVRSGKIKASSATAVLNKAITSKAKEVTLSGTGRNISLGLAGGITSGTSAVVSAISGVIARAKEAARKASGEGSPCKKFMPTGVNISRGLAVGMTKGISSVESAGRKVITAATKSMSVPNFTQSERTATAKASSSQTIYNIGDISIDASKVESAQTVEEIVRIFTKAKAFA